jgi:hypothetical protein
MNHEWPNLGHDSLVDAVRRGTEELETVLMPAGLSVRVLSYEVRHCHMVPELPGDRIRLYLGTGGPGHIDPALNDGHKEWSQGIHENSLWEPKARALFEAIRADEGAAMLAVCHSFGLMCHWSGVATPTLRGPEKGGKSQGVQTNVLTPRGQKHPWFKRMSAHLADKRHLRIADSRLFDLIPKKKNFPRGMTPIGFATNATGEQDTALTMLEFARDSGGVMPRIFAVNHHPEIHDRKIQKALLERKLCSGEVTATWCEERQATIGQLINPDTEHALLLTAKFTLLDPLRFHLYRQVRLRRIKLGLPELVHEDRVPEAVRTP